LALNIKAWKGGRPYIDARLERAPNESDASWSGSAITALGLSGNQFERGRKRRAHMVNDAGRIVAKINQYLFSTPAQRDDMSAEWAQDVSTSGDTITEFWMTASEYFTTGQWVWLGVDRAAPQRDPETGAMRPRTMAEREQIGDRVYWSVWPATDVVDWRFDHSGRLLWLLAQDEVYDNGNPFEESTTQKTRTLWRAGVSGQGATWTRFSVSDKVEQVATGSISTSAIPFVLLGWPSPDPWWFDDVEMIQAALLNLNSLHHENLVKTVFPQLVIPQTTLLNLQAKLVERIGAESGQRVTELVREVIRGLEHPFVEAAEESGITRYLMPSAQDLKAIPDQQDRLRRQLFDMAGLSLFNRETRQVQSAESKQFDQLDTAAALRNRSMLFQEAEAKLVALSREIDSQFTVYGPKWPTDFDVPNTSEDVASLTQLGNFAELTPGMRRHALKAALRLMSQIEPIEDAERRALLDEIEALGDEDEPVFVET
jgi:hypothetical protein